MKTKGGQRPTLIASTGAAAVMQITYGALIPLPLEEAFDFVSDPVNWPTFFSSLTAAEALDGWGAPGGKARLTITIRGQEVTSDLELLEWACPRHIRYIAHNQRQGAAALDTVNDRRFDAVDGGTQLSASTATLHEHGLSATGLREAVVLLASRRTWRQAMNELPAQASVWKRSRP